MPFENYAKINELQREAQRIVNQDELRAARALSEYDSTVDGSRKLDKPSQMKNTLSKAEKTLDIAKKASVDDLGVKGSTTGRNILARQAARGKTAVNVLRTVGKAGGIGIAVEAAGQFVIVPALNDVIDMDATIAEKKMSAEMNQGYLNALNKVAEDLKQKNDDRLNNGNDSLSENDEYDGAPCDFDEQSDSIGRKCGGRSATSRKGGKFG